MTTIGVLGTGQFARSFISLWQLHPDVDAVYACDIVPERAREHQRRYGLAGVFADAEQMFDSNLVDSVAIMTQRWTHGPLAVQAVPPVAATPNGG